MTGLRVIAGPFTFSGKLETELAPRTCEAVRAQLPIAGRLVHVRWSGEGVWIPFGDFNFGVGPENSTRYPSPGHLILYPGGGVSETEILLAYGSVSFASKAGPLAGNHFASLTSGLENLPELGRKVLWEGAQGIRIEPT